MKTKNTLLYGLALLSGALTGSVSAQEGGDSHAAVEDVAAAKAELGAPLVFGVEGLTKDNAEQVGRSLATLTENVYACPGCSHARATAGKCASCGVDLKVEKRPILSGVVPSAKNANLSLTPFAERTLSYSEIERTLAKDSIEIDDARFPLPGDSRLVLRGGSAGDVVSLEEALDDSGLFESADAEYDAVSHDIHIAVHSMGSSPTLGKVRHLVDALETKATLVDVVWGPKRTPAKI